MNGIEKEALIQILNRHRSKYPMMEPQDYGKLIYQNEFGPEHMIADEQTAIAYLKEERNSMPKGLHRVGVDVISGRLCRFPLSVCSRTGELALLAKLFFLTSEETYGTSKGLLEKIDLLETLPIPRIGGWMEEWKRRGCPAVHHSGMYRAAYRPHYRLLKKEYAAYFPALREISRKYESGGRVVVAVDGRCASGKTSFAALLCKLFPCNVFHMDDFFLPPDQRSGGWETTPAGNMDFERFRFEVLGPCVRGEEIHYRAYRCQKGAYGEATLVLPQRLTVVEGSYSQHPLLRDSYDLKIFFTCSKEAQTRRLSEREGEYVSRFEERWIPMEEHYIASYDVEKKSDLVVDTSALFEGREKEV